MKIVPILEQSDKVTELGVNCINETIRMMDERGRRFLWRDFESIKLLVEQIDALTTISDIVKAKMFNDLLPEFSDTVEPIDKI